ncbi:MAG: MFS transporter, partial [Mycobacteriales bacterium]
GLGPGLFAAAMTVGRLGTHLLGARLSEVRLVMGGGVLIAAGSLLLALATVPWVALTGILIVGSGVSVLAPTLFSAVGRRSKPGRQGADLAAVSALGYVGFLAGPPIVGLISGASSLPFALGLLGLLGLGLTAAAPRVLRDPARLA